MNIYSYEKVFGCTDRTTKAMRTAMESWFSLYYGVAEENANPCQRVAYTVVSKLCRSIFGEYSVRCDDPFLRQVAESLGKVCVSAMQLALVGGACYLKPVPQQQGFSFALVPRNRILIFARNASGEPTDVGTVAASMDGKFYYTLLERRTVDEKGFLTIENKLLRSAAPDTVGQPVPLTLCPEFKDLPEKYTYPEPVGSVGLVQLKTPMVNCVDGSADGVSVYAAAEGLIRNIDRNEAQLCGEFERGESRILVSKDLLMDGQLQEHVFVGLDEDPERVGVSIFSPQLRQQSYLERKQEYLRSVETVIGLQRGMLCDVNQSQRTATEISSSQQEHNLTAMDFQAVWEQALRQAAALCTVLGRLYRLGQPRDVRLVIDWGNGVVRDEEKTWQNYMDMVKQGLLAPEVALGWRFNLPADTPEQRAEIRKKFMPEEKGTMGS